MATRRVIAYCMHESEIGLATNFMPNYAGRSESFVLGDLDDDGIEKLRESGLVVQVIETPSSPPSFESLHGLMRTVSLSLAENAFGPMKTPPVDLTVAQYYLLWLAGPLLEEWRTKLADFGASVLEVNPSGGYKARLEPGELERVSKLPFVLRVRRLDGEDAGPDFVADVRSAATRKVTGARMLTFDIRLNRPEDRSVVRDWLHAHHIAVAGANDRKFRVYLLEDAPELGEIACLPGVAALEEYVSPKLYNDRARQLLGIDTPIGAHSIAESGAGEIVAVADTGIDDAHPDFAGRIVGTRALGRPSTWTDPHGHGTHVAGSVLGDGNASAGAYRGVAPGAQLFFQSLLDANGSLGGLPFDLADLFEDAYQSGARIHNNSWGSATQSRYTMNSAEVDEFVARRRDMLIVIAAGNDGTAAERRNSAPGFVDWLSIGSPASSKNSLTVGASRSDRSVGGYTTLTYGAAWPGIFPDMPISGACISGDSNCIAAFSSRGPCDDRRIKPDLVAPGTDIVSAKSSQAGWQIFWGQVSGNSKYAYMGGTSMAAPLVSGCAALVREYYVKSRRQPPSAALLKATLINGTSWLSGSDATAPATGVPNFHQGFGRLDMSRSIPNAGSPALRLEFYDNWQKAADHFTATGQRRRFDLKVNEGNKSLRICMAYTDNPARGLQNNLNLFVEMPGGKKMLGNAQLPNSLNIPDPDNNVEIVRFEPAAAGTYVIMIAATNLLKASQDFALVVVGEAIGSLIPS